MVPSARTLTCLCACARVCAAHDSSKRMVVHLDQYSVNDMKVFCGIMKKASRLKSLTLMLGQTAMDTSRCTP